MFGGIRGRVAILSCAAVLVGGAVVVRVWLAATGGYSDAPLAMPLRVSSGIGFFLGFLLAALAVAWPMKRAAGSQKPQDEAVAALRKESGTVYLCPRCGYAAKTHRPVTCPVCQETGETFLSVDTEALEAAVREQGGSQAEETFDGQSLRWAQAALEHLRHISDPYRRSRARLRIEKAARLAKLPVITLEFALSHVPKTKD